MTIQITIVGLGQIGSSFGLALQEKQDLLRRVGHDKEIRIARQAEKIKAVDRVEANLHKAIRDSDIILLCLPIDQLRETMQMIAMDLKESAIILDTAPAKAAASAWATELFPAGRYYIGLTPVLNPAYLHTMEMGVDAAHSDLFKGGLMGIVAPPHTDSNAIKLAADLTRLVGASPLFVDPLEIDGLMTATHILPQLLAAALINAVIDQPGWREGRKVAGRALAEASAPIANLLNEPQSLGVSSVLNRENILRMLDSVSASLEAMHAEIEASDELALNKRIERACAGRERWWAERQTGNWAEGGAAVEIPEPPGVMSRLFGGGINPKTKRTKSK